MAKYEIKDGVCTIPKGTKIIEMGAFKNCKELKELKKPPSVTRIEQDALLGCENLEKITLSHKIKELRMWGSRREWSYSDFKPFSLDFKHFTVEGLALDLIYEDSEMSYGDWN